MLLKKFLAICRRQVNRLRMDDDKSLDPTDSDIEQVVDAARADCGLPPVARSPEQGVADMQARIKELTADKRRLLNNDTLLIDARPEFENQLHTLNRQLREARQRLGEYRIQLEGRN